MRNPGGRRHNGRGAFAVAGPLRCNVMVAGFFAFLAAAAQMPMTYVNVIRKQTALLLVAESPYFKSMRRRYAAAFSDMGAAASLSPEAAMLVGEHEKVYATLARPPSTTTCR